LAKRECGAAGAMKRFESLFKGELPFFFMVPALVWQVLFLFIPVLIIVVLSFTGESGSFLPTLANYAAVFTWAHARIIARSFLLASLTAATALLIAYPVVYYIVLRVKRWRRLFLFLFILPFWTNFLVLVYSWFFLLEENGLINFVLLKLGIISEPLHLAHTVIATFVVMVYCYLPFMVMPLYSILDKLDARLLEASADLGATPWQTFMRVTIPLTLPGIKTGLLLVMVPAFGEFAIPTLIGGARYMMTGSLISYYFFVARDNGLGSAFTVIAGIILLGIALFVNKVCNNRYAHGAREGE
jgi:spermidine/putrescine transport system permease protein